MPLACFGHSCSHPRCGALRRIYIKKGFESVHQFYSTPCYFKARMFVLYPPTGPFFIIIQDTEKIVAKFRLRDFKISLTDPKFSRLC